MKTDRQGPPTRAGLPQGFKNSSPHFGATLAAASRGFAAGQSDCPVLHCVEGELLLAGKTERSYAEGTHRLPVLLWETGYEVS